jgi:PAS domain S-box-containing protein
MWERMREPGFDESIFFELTPDLMCIAGRDGFFRKVNPAVIKKLEYSEEELMARPISSFIYSEDKPTTQHRRGELLRGKSLLNFQNRYVTKSGKLVWLEWTSVFYPDRDVVFAIAKDITERKLIELELEEKYKKFKSLATHFKSSIEEDRKYLANELHEELAQLASVLKTDIEWLNGHVPGLSPISKSRFEHALGISKLLIRTIRRISFSISPNMLEHLGLNATLEWHCKEFSILNGIPCSFESDYEEHLLSNEVRIDLFRICQESLMNIIHHAKANHVRIRIEDQGGEIQLSIEDDGKGFEADRQKRSGGLIRMRERASSINGQLTVLSEPGKGTAVSVRIKKEGTTKGVRVKK